MGKTVGTGTVIIGASLIVSFFVTTFWNEEIVAFILLPPIVIGLAFYIVWTNQIQQGDFLISASI